MTEFKDIYGQKLMEGVYTRRDNVFGSRVSNVVYLSDGPKGLNIEYAPSSTIRPLQVDGDTLFRPLPTSQLKELINISSASDRKWLQKKTKTDQLPLEETQFNSQDDVF